MGACYSKITITDEMFLTLKSNPNEKLLLSLCLHYDIYDKVSQRKIDELCQISLTTEKGLNVFVGEARIPEDRRSADIAISAKENVAVE
jgi:hypothetical protein